MSVKRGPLPSDHFVIVANSWIRDPNLSWRDKGILIYLSSHQADYRMNEQKIIDAALDGRDAVRASLRSLEAAGYLRRIQTRTEDGTFAEVDYVLHHPAPPGDGRPVDRNDLPEDPVSPGQPVDGTPVNATYIQEDHQEEHPPSVGRARRAAPAKKATRLPEDFQPDERMRAWFAAEKLAAAGVDGRLEHDSFCDYWHASAGANARKLDWAAAWRNWMRKAAQSVPAGGGWRGVRSKPTGPVQSTTDQRVAAALALAEKYDRMAGKMPVPDPLAIGGGENGFW